MKKLFCALAAALLALSLGATALAAVPDKPDTYAHAYDFEGSVLSSSDIAEIERYGEALEKATGIQAVAVVVDFLDGMDPADYATDLINAWGIGEADEDNGVVLLLARGDRQIQIGTGKGIDRVLTGSRCGELIDDNIDYFANNQFGKGMRALYADVCVFLSKAQGKTLSLSGTQSASGVVSGYDEAREESSGGFLDMILTLIFIYIVVSVVFNSRKGGGGCMRYLFLGWLLDRRDDRRNDRRNNRRPPRAPRPPRPPRPPMGGFGGGPRFPRGGFGGGFGGGSRGGFGGGGFGGGGSRGGGGGRSF